MAFYAVLVSKIVKNIGGRLELLRCSRGKLKPNIYTMLRNEDLEGSVKFDRVWC